MAITPSRDAFADSTRAATPPLRRSKSSSKGGQAAAPIQVSIAPRAKATQAATAAETAWSGFRPTKPQGCAFNASPAG